MKLIIDEKVCSDFDLDISETLIGILFRLKVSLDDVIENLKEKGYLVETINGHYKLSEYFDDRITRILLNSDKEIPNAERCENLAIQMRALYPKGNSSSGHPWRGNLRDLTKRLQKFFKLYGNWTDDEIIAATQRYISHFNGNYTFMRILKYFIIKAENGEELSDLATWLENDTEVDNDNWLTDVK